MVNDDFTEVRCFSNIGEESDDASQIIENAKNLVMAALSRDYGNTGMVQKFSMDGVTYNQKNDEVKKAMLAFAGENSGIKKITERKHLVNAFDNPTFISIWNAIVRETLADVITNVSSAQIMALANIKEVDIGDSYTEEIETKGLPVAQRTSYNSNVTLYDSAATSPITIVPKPYTTGSEIDYIRILKNTFDFGKEMARVVMSLLYAQYKLVTGILFDSTNLTGSPLYQATFVPGTYIKMISNLQALNKTAVKAYGTIPAFQAIGAIATTNYGFTVQDEMIRNGYLGHAYGIDNIAIDQATDLSAPFTTANLNNLLLVPNDKILLLSDVGDKPVKLVRENFVRVLSKDPKSGSLYRQRYSYTQSFDAALITQAHYAMQQATAA